MPVKIKDSKNLQTIDWSVFVNISFQLSPLLAALSYYILSISHLQLLNSDSSSNLLYLEIISLLVLASDLIRHTLTCCEGYIVKLWSPLTRLTCGQLSSAPKAKAESVTLILSHSLTHTHTCTKAHTYNICTPARWWSVCQTLKDHKNYS